MTHPHHLRVEIVSAANFAWLAMEIWILAHSRRAARGESRDRGSFGVIILTITIAMTVAYNAYAGLPQLAIGWRDATLAAGVGMMAAGMILRIWSVLTLGAFFRVTVTLADEQRLVTAGPYTRLRHPSYAGAILTMAGLGLAMGNWASLAAMATGGLAAFGWRIHVEERALRAGFGAAWDAYAAKRWALIPFVW